MVVTVLGPDRRDLRLAGPDRFSVHVDSASTALGNSAAKFRAVEFENVPQDP